MQCVPYSSSYYNTLEMNIVIFILIIDMKINVVRSVNICANLLKHIFVPCVAFEIIIFYRSMY